MVEYGVAFFVLLFYADAGLWVSKFFNRVLEAVDIRFSDVINELRVARNAIYFVSALVLVELFLCICLFKALAGF